ncbi:tyrosine-type recombinase/integrase [Chamaesiphon sp. GL140_3_metabinner_50]|uniref:site-specific integrase n=1 Tax=Chamaesiphon sp. GL140_3_metabinner_50 TaxID=2970812 RepID=UPI0025D8DB93|nr:tyrosine-type recombinase/integrase [Chamaesiphon sp. GL140_3_metabinner_50]
MKRQQTGTVGIEVIGGRLRLRLPRQATPDTITRYISSGFKNTPDNLKKLQVIAWDIERDIKADKLAETYQSYIDIFKPKPVPKPTITKPTTFSQLWASYCHYKQPQLAATTYTQDYCKKWANHIAKLPQGLNKAIELRDALVAKVSADTAKRLLTLLAACGTWAVKSGLITANPFLGMAADLKRPKTDRSIDPFSATERDAILLGFQLHPRYSHYHSFVKFLFLTGCRTGEAISLQWKHIAPDLSSIAFTESYSSKLKIRKCTKTGKSRKFPANPDLRSHLATIKPKNAKPTDLVFNSPTGLPIDNSKFTNQIWKGCKVGKKTYKGILPSLIDSGAVAAYRCPYTTRHTFITMMLAAGLTIPQVANLVGNSPEIVLKHYAGNSVDLVPSI